MAERLTEGEEGKGNSQLASDLRESGIDPDVLQRRFYEAAKAIAAREMSGRTSCSPRASPGDRADGS